MTMVVLSAVTALTVVQAAPAQAATPNVVDWSSNTECSVPDGERERP